MLTQCGGHLLVEILDRSVQAGDHTDVGQHGSLAGGRLRDGGNARRGSAQALNELGG